MTEAVIQEAIAPALLERGESDAKAAVRLFPNPGLHRAASAFGVAHERAIQYLEQAPILVLGAMAGGPGVRRINTLYINHRVTPLCERGAPLKDVLRAFGLATQLRKLVPSALFPSAGPVVFALSELPPHLLGRIIPEKPGDQKVWLSALCEWRDTMRRRQRSLSARFAWAAEALSRGKVRRHQVSTVADFASTDGVHFNEAWRWPRANEEATLWHARISISHQLRGTPFTADTVVDLGPHPDKAHHDGFDFIALRTPADLAEEGTAMRHCVASYVHDVINGRCNIVGVRKDGKRIATLELVKGSVVQLKGPCNAVPPTTAVIATANYTRALKTLRHTHGGRGARR